jgi:predicted nucleic acid-binding protein
MVLVDTSVWISHFRGDFEALSELLDKGTVATHPYVIEELACGNLKNREEILSLMQALPMALSAEHDEVRGFIESRRLMGQGLGIIDVHLLASALLSGIEIWTEDRRLAKTAAELDIAFY